MEYRMIDYDMFDEDIIHEINGLSKRGWKIIRVLDPMKWANSDGMFIRIFYERESQKAKTGTEQCNLPDVKPCLYKPDFIKWRDKYFKPCNKVYNYKSKHNKTYHTTEMLHKDYERAMLETPFK